MLRDRIDYSTYRAGIAEKLLCSVVGSAIGILIGYTFYEHVIAAQSALLLCLSMQTSSI